MSETDIDTLVKSMAAKSIINTPWWRVTTKRMAVRSQPAISSKCLCVLREGAVVLVRAMRQIEGVGRWLQLEESDLHLLMIKQDSEGWMLLDGAAAGLSEETLLQPAAEHKSVCGENVVTIPFDKSLNPQVRGRSADPEAPPRFVLLPPKPGWQGKLRSLGFGVHTAIGTGRPPPRHHEATAMQTQFVAAKEARALITAALEKPPPARDTWLVPCNHHAAACLAHYQKELRSAGWRVSDTSERVVLELANKASLRARAERLGLLDALPRHFGDAATARYPSVLKPADGEHGRDVMIVKSAEEAVSRGYGWGRPGTRPRQPPPPPPPPQQPPLQPTAISDNAAVGEVAANAVGEAAANAGHISSGSGSVGSGDNGGYWVLQELIPGRIEYV